MQKFYTVIFSILFLPLFSLAQTNYKPGYVVTLKGDTLHGFIDYKEWEKNPTDIHFKSSINSGGVQNFSSKNADAFGIMGFEYYKRYTVAISQDPVEIGKLSPVPDTTTLVGDVFLKIITRGKRVTLFAYTDNIKPRFFILENGETIPQELVYHAYYNPDQSASVQHISRYRSQLINLARRYDVNNDNTSILQANYNEAELTEIVTSINGAGSQQFTTKKLFGIRFFAGASVNYNTATFTGLIAFPKNAVVVPKISIGMDFLTNKNIQSLYLRAEISYSSSQYKLYSDGSNFSFGGNPYSFNFKQSTISLSPQLVYNIYNTDKFKFFINGSILFNLSSYDNYNVFVHYSTSTEPFVVKNYPSLEKTWITFGLKTGILLNKKLEIFASYIVPQSITTFVSSQGKVETIAGGLNYLFGAK